MKVYEIVEAPDVDVAFDLADTLATELKPSTLVKPDGTPQSWSVVDQDGKELRKFDNRADAEQWKKGADARIRRATIAARNPNNSGKLTNVTFDKATGKLSGNLPDGTPFKDLDPDDARVKIPGYKAKKAGFVKRLLTKGGKVGFWGGLTALFGALQVYFVFEDAGDKIAEVYTDLENMRFKNKSQRQEYYDAQMRKINKAKWVNAITTALGSVMAGVAGAAAARRVAAAFAGITRFAGPWGFVVGLLVMALVEGLVWLGSYAFSKYGEDIGAWLADSVWDTMIETADTVIDTGIDTVTSLQNIRGEPPEVNRTEIEQALDKDENDPNSGNPSDEAREAVRGSDPTGGGWLN